MKIAAVLGYTIIATIFLAITSCKSNESNKITIKEGGDYNVIVMNKEAMKFGVSEGKPENTDFYIKSNFFKNEGPIGLVVVDGIRKNSRVKGGGYFMLKKEFLMSEQNLVPK